jgi:hypothetical protein
MTVAFASTHMAIGTCAVKAYADERAESRFPTPSTSAQSATKEMLEIPILLALMSNVVLIPLCF